METFSLPKFMFRELGGLGERLLGGALHQVLVKVGALHKDAPLDGSVLLEAADKVLQEKRPDRDRIAALLTELQEVHGLVKHAQVYLRNKTCYCRDLDNGEHAQQPICSVCALGRAEGRARRALQ